ncbi:MAG: polyphosphate kinase 1 [Burkholderiales bacterium]|nr:polyphosphate kinase 1 [Burkholderiales bacterium]
MLLQDRPAALRLLNRELGILAFNERVLALAEDPSIPLLERLRYLTIVSNNLDELFEVRVAELKELVRADPMVHLDGVPVADTLRAVAERAGRLVARQYVLLNRTLTPALAAEGIVMLLSSMWTDAQRAWAEQVFDDEIEPLLTPIALDPAHPFPRILNKSLNFVIELDGTDAFGRRAGIAIVQAPRALPRVIRVPSAVSGAPHGLMLLTSIVGGFVGRLFPGLEVRSVNQFRVTRNSELFVDEEEITDLREALHTELTQRHYGDEVRLEVSAGMGEAVLQRLMTEFDLGAQDCFRVDGPVNLVRLQQVIDLVDRPELKFPSYEPGVPAAVARRDLFASIRRQDVLLHHPYESFVPVMDFLRSAAVDPKVVAIKQTIYRTGADSALMESLVAAARAGKEVTVVVELMARFDEEANINWASRLEEAGAHVVYGVVGHKTHAKLAMLLRREDGVLRRYAHLGTGNYHPSTARLYEDFGLFTADTEICADVHEVFRRLTGTGRGIELRCLLQAPFTLAAHVLMAIRREAEAARAGRRAYIAAKVNALLDPTVIEALYQASQDGVKIDLIVRGVCALRPGVPGLSKTIRVRSVIGRFLEHSRIYHFHADGRDEVWLASADWMGRNLYRRVEVAFPVRDRRLKARVLSEGIAVHLRDNASAWTMDAEGTYTRRRPRGPRTIVSQQALIAKLAGG